jgi:fucose permease
MRAGAGRPPARAGDDAQVRAAQVRKARNAVCAVFIGHGFLFASWASRIPQIRSELRVTPGVLGLILLCTAVGSVIATPLSGLVISWFGEARTVVVMSLTSAAGMAVVAVGYQFGIAPVAAGLFVFGLGTGAWDVAMNVQGAAVEQGLGRAILPRFHAGWSIGTVAGAAAGAAMVALGVPITVHLLAAALVIAVAVPAAALRFLPATRATRAAARQDQRHDQAGGRRSPLQAWAEPRTVLIGLFVLCMAFTEGTGNDWLSLAMIDGYHTAAAIGTLTLAIFLAAMTTGRWFGPRLIDRYGRVPVLRACAAVALAGLLMIDFGTFLPVAFAGAVLLGLGTSLGFPVGLSSAADDSRYAAPRVSTAASIGYVAFLAGPPAIGFLGDHIGVLHSLSGAAVLLAAALFLCRATAPISPPDPGVSPPGPGISPPDPSRTGNA